MNRPLASLLCLLASIYISATSLIMGCEDVSFGKATGMVLPAFLGELGMVEGHSAVTQVSVIAALVVSIAFVAVITASFTSMFIEFCRRGGIIMEKVSLSNHIIICGWNFQGERILSMLLSTGAEADREIVILADCEQRPTKDERVDFVRGDPTQDEDLTRVGVKEADSVIVLSDLTKAANEADAEALMIVLAVESLNRKAHTCVQIVNSSNRVHLERAHADEIICLDQMGGNLVVASAINHGVSRVVSELLTFNCGSEFYRYDAHLSDDLVGKEFVEAAQVLARQRMILLAVETDESEELRQRLSGDILNLAEEGTRAIVVNPQNEYRIRQGDALFLIAESEPTDL